MDIQQRINLAIVRQLAERDIRMAYPTRTIVMGLSDHAEPADHPKPSAP
jgi:small-conductance mechanosensitive channel